MNLAREELQNLRKSYKLGALSEQHCAPTPKAQFEAWFQEALKSEIDEPNAFTLSTISGGHPSARVVLFKGFEQEGPVFYSNYDSPKGQQLTTTPFAAATFLWLPLERQVRIEGAVQKVSAELSDDYFATRPRGSQIGAAASPQGQVVGSREELEMKFAEIESRYPEGTLIPRPANWGGFVIVPTVWEFWQGRRNRLHDRIRYRLDCGVWIKERLAP
jgi:pyridoxamine 5'-phosphate oxidase